jgi:uncharacterized protein YdiU (UPF0061 family)
MVHWMRVGFVHGVMNTDNMSILGLTIDYGPYGWVDNFDPGWTPNTTDASSRRYCFARQPAIARWNLERLADALARLVPRSRTSWPRLSNATTRSTLPSSARHLPASSVFAPGVTTMPNCSKTCSN